MYIYNIIILYIYIAYIYIYIHYIYKNDLITFYIYFIYLLIYLTGEKKVNSELKCPSINQLIKEKQNTQKNNDIFM